MNGTKVWYKSKTIIGALVAIAASVGAFSDQMSASFTSVANMLMAIMQLAAAIGSVYALYGRIKANKTITLRNNHD